MLRIENEVYFEQIADIYDKGDEVDKIEKIAYVTSEAGKLYAVVLFESKKIQLFSDYMLVEIVTDRRIENIGISFENFYFEDNCKNVKIVDFRQRPTLQASFKSNRINNIQKSFFGRLNKHCRIY